MARKNQWQKMNSQVVICAEELFYEHNINLSSSKDNKPARKTKNKQTKKPMRCFSPYEIEQVNRLCLKQTGLNR